MKKPLCPVCGSDIELSEMVFSGYSASDSCAIGGYDTYLRYKCKCHFGVCGVSIDIYNAQQHKVKKPENIIGRASNWRDALKRFNCYVDFMQDNKLLRNKLLALSDDNLHISGDWSHLMPSGTD